MIRPDVQVEVRVRNNLILRAMAEKKINGAAELCREMGIAEYSCILSFINMKQAARDDDGTWHPIAIKLADFFLCMPEDLFSEAQQYVALEKNRGYGELAIEEIQRLAVMRQTVTPELSLQVNEFRAVVAQVLQTLTSREERVIRLRFGFNSEEKTLTEVGEIIGVCGPRVGQIEAKALRKLKHPARTRPLRSALENEDGRFDRVLLDNL